MPQRGIIGGVVAGSLAVAVCAVAAAFGPGWLNWAAALGAIAVAVGLLMSWSQPPAPVAVETDDEDDGTLPLVRKLSTAIDASDPLTRGRSYRVSHFAVKVGKRLGLSGSELRDLEYAALLHDIGRTAIHYDVLMKRGSLSAAEQASVRTHPAAGYEILKDVPGLEKAACIVRAHHEQPNGHGYPEGLTETHIPIGSRIIMVIAAFDALTSDRPYRPGLSPEVAYEELRAHKGSMFFADVVDALIVLHQSGAIFEGFDTDEIALYAQGIYNSKAVESHLEACGQSVKLTEEIAEGPALDVPEDIDLDNALEMAGDRKAS